MDAQPLMSSSSDGLSLPYNNWGHHSNSTRGSSPSSNIQTHPTNNDGSSSNDSNPTLSTPTTNITRLDVNAKIEEILEAIAEALLENRIMSISVQNRRSGKQKLVRFPSTDAAEVKRFSALSPLSTEPALFALYSTHTYKIVLACLDCILTILSMSHEALLSGTMIAKRFAFTGGRPIASPTRANAAQEHLL